MGIHLASSDRDRVELRGNDDGAEKPPAKGKRKTDYLGLDLAAALARRYPFGIELDRSDGSEYSIMFGSGGLDRGSNDHDETPHHNR